MDYQRHPESEIFPPMAPEEFKALVQSMRANGFDAAFPIILFEGMIVDGWHRYNAARQAGVEPVFRDWGGTEGALRDFIIYANSTRRHLSKAAHAQALIIANATAPAGKRLTAKQITDLTGAASSTVSEQQRIFDQDPETAKQVAAGAMAATVAVRRKLKKEPDAKEGRWVEPLSQRLTEKAKPWALELGETPNRFVQRAVAERIERMALQRAE